MKLLKAINDSPLSRGDKVSKRLAVRAVLFNDDYLIPLLYVSKYKYHKLPGGGIKKGEDRLKALSREILEETGCVARIDREIGKVTEYRSKFNLYQTSYCYLGEVIKTGQPSFTKKENNGGFKLVWLNLREAMIQIGMDEPSNYEGKFIRERDLKFLEEVQRNYSTQT